MSLSQNNRLRGTTAVSSPVTPETRQFYFRGGSAVAVMDNRMWQSRVKLFINTIMAFLVEEVKGQETQVHEM